MISNPNNPTIRQVRKLRKRRERERRRQMIVEGHRALGVAIASNAAVSRVFHTKAASIRRKDLLSDAREHGATVEEVSPAVMSSLTSVSTAPDVLGVAAMPSCSLEEAVRRMGLGAVLAGVRDPATAGSVLSSCAAAGGAAAIATKGTTDLFAPKSVRSAAGAHFVLSIAIDIPPDSCVTALRAAGVRILAVNSAGAAVSGMELAGPIAVLVAEDGALDPALAAAAERQVGAGARASAVRPSLGAEAAVVLFSAAQGRAEETELRRGDV